MPTKFLLVAVTALVLLASASADPPHPRALAEGKLPNDARLEPLKDLNGYFPFTPPKSKEEWNQRADEVRRRVLVSQGLWPMPTKTPLNAVIHGRIDRPECTVEKVYFESAPGLFVTGNLYRPKNVKGKVPAVLFAHGHWQDARLSSENDDFLRREIATGQERFECGGHSRFQSLCVQLARMGCVVWQWDMLSDSDSVQFSRGLVHGFKKQRPEMNAVENWGLFSPQAESHLQSIMGLHTLNSIRSLDFVLGLPEVDPTRIAMTGASGGGTQTMILSAVDPRLALSFPAVMVSTAMQGGCTCENASLLRVGTGNVEFAALFAPKPQGMTCADDWTHEMSAKGFPELQKLYELVGAPKDVMLARGEQFPHNYNAVSRSAFYTWLNKHFKLGAREPVIEQDYEPLSRDQLTVWDKEHPAPKAADADFERQLCKWLADDAAKQLKSLESKPDEYRKIVSGAAATIVGRTYDTAGDVEWKNKHKEDRGACLEMTGLLRNKTHNEELPVAWLYPKKWNGRVVVWLDDAGKASLFAADGSGAEKVSGTVSGSGGVESLRKTSETVPDTFSLAPAVKELVDGGTTVLGVDLLYQGEFLKDDKPVTRTRVVSNSRECAAYTFGYNDSLFAQRVHDVLTVVKYLRTAKLEDYPSPSSVSVAGFGSTGPICIVARAVAGDAIDQTAAETHGFRFAKLLDFRDPAFLPGGAKYGDLPGFAALGGTHRLLLINESNPDEIVAANKITSGKPNDLVDPAEPEKQVVTAKWLLK